MSLGNLLKTFKDEKIVVEEAPNKYVEKDKGGVSLKGVLQRGRLKLSRERIPYAQGVSFRPSTITFGYCRRAKVVQLAGLVDLYDDTPPPRLQLVFDMGNAIHDIFHKYFWDIGLLKGTYYCLKCDKSYDDLLSPTACPSGIKSHTKAHMQYREVQARCDEYLIRGRCDGILIIDGEEHIVDFKSIANRTLATPEQQVCFEDLVTGPKDDHVVQLNLYMWMLGVHRGHLLYIGKNNHQIKSFAIPYDESVIRPYLDEIRELITTAEKLRSGTPVELPGPCNNEKCKCHEFLSIKAA